MALNTPPVSEWLGDFRDYLRNQLETIPTGIPGLDRMFGGGLTGGVYALAAPPGAGKTDLAVQVAVNALTCGHEVQFFTFELAREVVLKRAVRDLASTESDSCRLTMGDLRKVDALDGCKRDSLVRAMAGLEGIADRFYIEDGADHRTDGGTADDGLADGYGWPTVDAEEIAGTVYNGQLTVVDYVQTVPRVDADADDLRAIESTSAILRDAARHHDAPVLILSSLTKAGDIKGTSNLGHDATAVMYMRYTGIDGHSTEADRQAASMRIPRLLDLVVEKNREGATGIVRLAYWPQFGLFREVSSEND